MKRHNVKQLLGFTLIELLVGMAILAVLFAIVISAVNPVEQFSKATDVSLKAKAKDLTSATKYYFTYTKTLPWKKDPTCKEELTAGQTLDEMPSCVSELTQGGQLQTQILSSSESKDIHVTECSDGLAICYKPKSKTFNNDPEVKYTKDGVVQPGCPDTSGSSDCYACSFSTNEAEECFQALRPNGTLALAPSPAPNDIIPIPARHSKSTCSNPQPGEASCMASVVTDSVGNPLSSLALPAGFGPAQIHSAYNLPCTPGGSIQSNCNSPSSFGPRTIAVAIAYHDPTLESDLAVYNQIYNLPTCSVSNGCLTIVNQNGATSPLPSINSNWALEESLDVQMSHAVCQTCKILVVEANSNTFTDLGTAVNRAAQMGAAAISNSYGAAEWSGSTAYDTYYNHPGTFITASSGDWGYGSYYPAASKNVIAVGGTTLSLFANNGYSSESVWSGTGSGCSVYQSANTFQTALSNWNLTHCGQNRGITDVSAVADPNTGVAIYDSTAYSGRSGWWILGGTSVSSPIISATLALMGDSPSGSSSASYIYSNTSKFRDITSGSNGSCGGTTACTAAAGYDGPTGIGSPNLLSIAGPEPSSSPTNSPTPTIPPTPTSAPLDCSQPQTVTLLQSDPVATAPGEMVSNTLTIKSNDSPGCSSQYTISYGFPGGWNLSGIPASFTLEGGATKDLPFTIRVSTSTEAGNYVYQFWVAKAGQSSANPVNGTIQVLQIGPTNTPTPAPIFCGNPWSISFGNTNLTGNAGGIVNESLTITNGNPAECSGGSFGISYATPGGFSLPDIPASLFIPGAQSKTANFTITIPQNAVVGNDYLIQFWINSGDSPHNITVHVSGVATPTPTSSLPPTPTPTQTPLYPIGGYSLNSTKLFRTYSMFAFPKPDFGPHYQIDVSLNPDFSGSWPNVYHGFAYCWDGEGGTSTSPGEIALRKLTSSLLCWQSLPYGTWVYNQQCGKPIYWRVVNDSNTAQFGLTNTTTEDCQVKVNAFANSNDWYLYYPYINSDGTVRTGQPYDSNWDPNNDGKIDWTDYWILAMQTRMRAGGWQLPE